MNRGLLKVAPTSTDLKKGSKRRLGGGPLTDGHWAKWLPVPKDQQPTLGVEPNDCVSHGTLKAVEILQNFLFSQKNDYSERFLAKMTGTDVLNGNDPNTVAQFLKNKGCALEADWPQSTATSFQGFYANIPQSIQTLALDFVDEFAFGHEWVTDTSQSSLMEALKFSPLGVGVYAWQPGNETGFYVNPMDLPAEHYVTLYDYEANYYWLVYDSYVQEIKKLAWNFPFEMVKRYTLQREIVDERWFVVFLKQIRSILGL